MLSLLKPTLLLIWKGALETFFKDGPKKVYNFGKWSLDGCLMLLFLKHLTQLPSGACMWICWTRSF